MIDLVYLILCLLSFINLNIKGSNSFYEDYMDLENTSYIKGIFVWMIFFRHFTGYLNHNYLKNKTSILIDKYFKQNLVSLFLFYSGYGILESFKKKGNKYIKSLPNKSAILLIKSEIVLFIFFCNNMLLGIKTTSINFLQAIIFRKSIGNSYWFIITIIILYIHAFISFFLIKKNNFIFIGIILITIICLLHICFMYRLYHPKEIISVDTIICFVLGFYYSFIKSYIDKIIMKNDIIYFGILSILIIKYYKIYIYNPKSIYNLSLKNGYFTLSLILISMKIRFKNNFLFLLNSHSYSIYLLQRIVMIYIYRKGHFKNNEFIGFFCEFIIVIMLAILFDKYTIFIDNFFKRNKKLNNKIENYTITKKLNNKELINQNNKYIILEQNIK